MSTVPAVLVCAASFVLFWMRGLAQLYTRHPHEDAFILYQYVEHLAAGAGIVFNRAGPPAEGATDFLWMVLLAIGVRLGSDVAIVALALNALGSALLSLGLLRLCTRVRSGPAEWAFALVLACVLPFVGGALAGYDGFSTQLYCALILGIYLLFLEEQPTALPYAALILGLFRPDGLVVGVGFCVLGALCWARDPLLRRQLVIHGGIAIGLGAVYFVWRAAWFGELLPLPLYVKSRGGERLPGLAENLAWLKGLGGPAPLLALGTTLFCLQLRALPARERALRIVWGGVPLLGLLGALSFAHQAQNVDYRFQAPVFTILLAGCIALAAELSKRLWRAIAMIVCLSALAPALYQGKTVWPVEYIDSFAVRFGKVFTTGTIALTEAGRLPYWTDATVIDLVGLNTVWTAHRPVTVRYLEKLEPDIVFFHVAGTISPLRLMSPRGTKRRGAVLPIEPASLLDAVDARYRRYLRDFSSYEQADITGMKLASLTTARFLARSTDFDVFVIRYGTGLKHVIGIRRDRPYTERVTAELLRNTELPYLSYAEAKGFRSNDAACRAVAWVAARAGPERLGLPRMPACDHQEHRGRGGRKRGAVR